MGVKKEKLQDICSLITDGAHSSPPTVEEGKSIASVKDMTEYGIDLDSCRKISDKDYHLLVKSNCQPQIDDVLIAKDGSYLKKVFVVEEEPEYVTLSSIGIFRPNKNFLNPYYLNYYFHLESFRRYVTNGFVSGTALKRIVLDAFKRIEITLPDLKSQEEIVDQIKPLDDKIKVNENLIIEIENYTELIFQKWFIHYQIPNQKESISFNQQGFPNDWKMTSVKKACKLLMGQSPPSTSYNLTGEGFPFYQGVVDFGEKYPSPSKFCTAPTRLANARDVLLSVRAPVGRLNVAIEECCIGRGVASVSIPETYNYYTFYELKRRMNRLIRQGSGTVFDAIKKDDIEKLDFLIPPKYLINQFEELIHPLQEKIANLTQQNKRLSELRSIQIKKLIQ